MFRNRKAAPATQPILGTLNDSPNSMGRTFATFTCGASGSRGMGDVGRPNDGRDTATCKANGTFYLGGSAPGTRQRMRENLGQWAAASEKRDRLNAMIALATSEQPIPIAVEHWTPTRIYSMSKTEPSTCGPANYVNIDAKIISRNFARSNIRRNAGIDPDRWLEFLNKIFASSAPLIRFVQQLIGMSLVGDVQEHVLPIFYGVGANGKSVLIETVCGMLGPITR